MSSLTEPADRTERLRDGVEMALYIALSLLAVSLTRDARLVASVEAASHLGWLLLALYSGMVIDRLVRSRSAASVPVSSPVSCSKTRRIMP